VLTVAGDGANDNPIRYSDGHNAGLLEQTGMHIAYDRPDPLPPAYAKQLTRRAYNWLDQHADLPTGRQELGLGGHPPRTPGGAAAPGELATPAPPLPHVPQIGT
jgi:hypothetical protein